MSILSPSLPPSLPPSPWHFSSPLIGRERISPYGHIKKQPFDHREMFSEQIHNEQEDLKVPSTDDFKLKTGN
jgi:hypothetical protein